jgi:hypothetical protein
MSLLCTIRARNLPAERRAQNKMRFPILTVAPCCLQCVLSPRYDIYETLGHFGNTVGSHFGIISGWLWEHFWNTDGYTESLWAGTEVSNAIATQTCRLPAHRYLSCSHGSMQVANWEQRDWDWERSNFIIVHNRNPKSFGGAQGQKTKCAFQALLLPLVFCNA